MRDLHDCIAVISVHIKKSGTEQNSSRTDLEPVVLFLFDRKARAIMFPLPCEGRVGRFLTSGNDNKRSRLQR